MPPIRSHRDLIVWQKSMDLTVETYELAKRLPKSEDFRLTSQMTRAASSIPACIAEGHERSTAKDYGNFLAMAQGSLAELDTFLTLTVRLGYIGQSEITVAAGLCDEVGRMLSTLRMRLRATDPRSRVSADPTPKT